MPQHPEVRLVSALVSRQDWAGLLSEALSAQHFTVCREEMDWLERMVAKYGSMPSKSAFKSRFPRFSFYKIEDSMPQLAQAVREDYARTQMVKLVESTARSLSSETELERVINDMARGAASIQHMVQDSRQNNEFDAFGNWQDTFSVINERVRKVAANGTAGIPTGFPTLDDLTGGIQAGWFTVLAARLGHGKTWTGIRMGSYACFLGHKVVYFSLEQGRHQISSRCHTLASSQYGRETFQNMALNKGHVDVRAYRSFLEEFSTQVKGRFIVEDSRRGRLSSGRVMTVIERQRPDIVYIDYLTLMDQGGDDWRATARLSAELQQVAQSTGVPVVALSQMNRAAIGKGMPGADNISQSDAIGHDADLIVAIRQESKRVLKMKVSKFRHGIGGHFWYCKFMPNTGQIDEISGDEAEDLRNEDGQDP